MRGTAGLAHALRLLRRCGVAAVARLSISATPRGGGSLRDTFGYCREVQCSSRGGYAGRTARGGFALCVDYSSDQSPLIRLFGTAVSSNRGRILIDNACARCSARIMQWALQEAQARPAQFFSGQSSSASGTCIYNHVDPLWHSDTGTRLAQAQV